MWFGNLLIHIGICCNSEMLGLMAGGCFGVFASSLLVSCLYFLKRESG